MQRESDLDVQGRKERHGEDEGEKSGKVEGIHVIMLRFDVARDRLRDSDALLIQHVDQAVLREDGHRAQTGTYPHKHHYVGDPFETQKCS